jgi:hypothetical protein
MGIQLKNNASGTLATAISASDTGIVLTTGNGASFPALAAGDYFYATLESTGGTFEVIKVTVRSGDSMTVVRAQEGSTANSFAAGSRIELRVTAASATEFLQSGTGAVIRNFRDKLRETVSVKDFGAVGDGITDNATAFQALHTYLAQDNISRFVLIPEGHYSTTYPLTIVGYGVHVVGTGKVVISAPDGATNLSLSVGNWGDLSPSGGNAITGNLLKNASEIQIGSVAGYRVNDVVLVYSGTSANATLPLNYIPLYKQWFTIREINTSTNTLKFTAQSDYDFLVSEGAKVTVSSATPAVSGSIQNIQFTNTSGFAGAYLHAVPGAVNFTIRDCRFDGFSSCGFTAASDQLTYDNVVFVGFNGLSAARFTGHVNYLNCTYRPRYTSPQNIGAFMEETPNTVYIENCDIRSRVMFTNSSDAIPPKRFILKNSRIETLSGTTIFASGYNSDGYAVIIDGCEIIGPGGAPLDGSANLTMIDYAFSDSIQVTNCTFQTSGVSVYAIYGSSLAGGKANRMIFGNKYNSTIGPASNVPSTVGAHQTEFTGSPTISDKVTVLNQVGYNADAEFVNQFNSGFGYATVGTRVTDVNAFSGYLGVNLKAGDNNTFTVARTSATYSGWGVFGYVNRTAFAAQDQFLLRYVNASGTVKTYLGVDVNGIVTPGATANNQDLGSGAKEWRDIYLVNSPIVSSDRNRKQQIQSLSDHEKAVAAELKGLIRKYKLNSAVDMKGEAARFHVGFISQDVKQAFVNHGLDPDQYGVVCTETWWQDEDGNIYQTENVEDKVLTEHSRIAIRYEELLAFVISAL